uniref:Uncharacterized protein n=1 Tax=Alexandrium monilatum TaxID=311494 RepID=A0A7S4VP70_9DINO|mmetsp:Transcript_28629/g.85254  ORF Transcript_28629/g.85254 Transcript_28629/m.85254 type:complete len:106 (+) Transcript_28629:77-394(+)
MPLLEIAAATLILAGARLGACQKAEASGQAAREGEPQPPSAVASEERTDNRRRPQCAEDTEGDDPWVLLDMDSCGADSSPARGAGCLQAPPPEPWELVDRPPGGA